MGIIKQINKSSLAGGFSNADGDTVDQIFTKLTEKTSERDALITKLNTLNAPASLNTQGILGLEAYVTEQTKYLNEWRDKALACDAARASKNTGSAKNKACGDRDVKYANWQNYADRVKAGAEKVALAKADKVSLEQKIAALQVEIEALNKEYQSKSGNPPVNTSTGNASNDQIISSSVNKFFPSEGINKMYYIIGGGLLVLGLAGFVIFKKK